MPTAAEKAKAAYQAVLDNPGRNDASHYNQRVMTTRYPSSGGSEMTNFVTRRESMSSRRESTSSQGSTQQAQRRWSMVKDWMNRPAY